jgi:hypothetical protein
MENNFNKGDMVVCTMPTTGVKKGKQYEVVDVATNRANGISGLIAIIDETGGRYYYSDRRFITTKQQKENLKLMLISKVKFNYNKLDSLYW